MTVPVGSIEKVFQALKNTEFCTGLSDDAIRDIAAFSTLLHLANGERLFAREQEADDDLFLLVQGNLDVVVPYQTGQATASEKPPREMLLSPVEHELFGEIAWILKSPRIAMIKSRGVAEVVRVHGKGLDDYLQTHPEVGMRVMQHVAALLARKLTHANAMFKMFVRNCM